MKKHFLKGIAAILCLCLFLSFGAALADSVYAFEDTFIRSTPGNTGSVLKDMREGTSGKYLEESEVDQNGVTWYYVSFGTNQYDGVKGWVSDRYAELRPDAVASSAIIPPDKRDGWPYVDVIDYPYAERVIARNGKTFIRSGPSTAADERGTFPKGAVAAYMGWCCTDMNGREWYYISYNDRVGWVSARYTVIE